MKAADATALAALKPEPRSAEMLAAYGKNSLSFGADCITCDPLDPCLRAPVLAAVAQAALASGARHTPHLAHHPQF